MFLSDDSEESLFDEDIFDNIFKMFIPPFMDLDEITVDLSSDDSSDSDIGGADFGSEYSEEDEELIISPYSESETAITHKLSLSSILSQNSMKNVTPLPELVFSMHLDILNISLMSGRLQGQICSIMSFKSPP